MKKEKKNEYVEKMSRTLDAFKISYDKINFRKGIFVDEILVDISPGEKISRLDSIREDLCRELQTQSLMIVNSYHEGLVSIQIPKKRPMVLLSNITTMSDTEASVPKITIGLDMSGDKIDMSLSDMVHMLVCGATRSGKSVFLRSIIQELSFFKNLKFVLIDPKFVEFSHFANSNKLNSPVIHSASDAIKILDELISTMNERYVKLMREKCVNISEYNEKNKHKMNYIVLVCDELADLMSVEKKAIEDRVATLAAKSRAVGIHLILATQRASTDIVTGKLKVNLTTRVCFKVPTQVDSRVILDASGAENLCGKGDGIILSQLSSGMKRFQGAFIDTDDLMIVEDDKNIVRLLSGSSKNKSLSSSEEIILSLVRMGKNSIKDLQENCNMNASLMFRTTTKLVKNKVIVRDGDKFLEVR